MIGMRMKVREEATKQAPRKCRHYRFIIVLGVLVSLGIVDVANGFVVSRPGSPTSCRWRRRRVPFGSELLRSVEPRHSGGESVDDNAAEEKGTANDNETANATANATANGGSASLLPLLKLASAHCASQALHTAVQLKIPDILHEKQRCCSLDEICEAIAGQPRGNSHSHSDSNNHGCNCNRDALLRTMRLLTTIDIVREERLPPSNETARDDAKIGDDSSFGFSLTDLGASLRSALACGEPTMASCVSHWMEAPLWDAWLGLPGYIKEGASSALPFERANGGVSSDRWYNREDHPESLGHANDFVRLIHDREIRAVAGEFDWSFCRGKRLVDVGGHNGKLAEAIARREPTIDCYCLDLPGVIEAAAAAAAAAEGFDEEEEEARGVTLVPGNVFEPATIPACDVILMKHFCDRCMWTESETVDLLVSCKSALLRGLRESANESESSSNDNGNDHRGRIIIADAVLPDCGEVDATNELSLYLDALYMLVGRERQRTKLEWEQLANAAGLDLRGIESTGVPSCSLIVLETRP